MPFASVNDKKIYYTVAKPSSVATSFTTLLCIHGLGSTNSFYAPLTPHLTTLGFTVVAIDSHGAGLSPYTGKSNSTTSIADDAWAVLESLKEEVPQDVVVLGHSMGGIVASELALKHGERVKGVVLIGPVNPNPGAAEAFEKRIVVVQEGTHNLDGDGVLLISNRWHGATRPHNTDSSNWVAYESTGACVHPSFVTRE